MKGKIYVYKVTRIRSLWKDNLNKNVIKNEDKQKNKI